MKPARSRPLPSPRSYFKHFMPITTRWMDNDIYGHVNNVVYYSFFDTAVNQFLIEQGALDISEGASIGLVVRSECDYFSPLSFPGVVDAGIRVNSVGTTSVSYEIGLFSAGAEQTAARGHFVHVYVDRLSRRPAQLPLALQQAVTKLCSTLTSVSSALTISSNQAV